MNNYPYRVPGAQVATKIRDTYYDAMLTVRLPTELLDEIDRLAMRRFSKRADTARHLIVLGIHSEQARLDELDR